MIILIIYLLKLLNENIYIYIIYKNIKHYNDLNKIRIWIIDNNFNIIYVMIYINIYINSFVL